MSAPKELTGSDAGLSGDDQIRIAFVKSCDVAAAPGCTRSTAVESVLQPRGLILSDQGRASLRFFVNRVAVLGGYIHPYDRENPGWRITERGRQALSLRRNKNRCRPKTWNQRQTRVAAAPLIRQLSRRSTAPCYSSRGSHVEVRTNRLAQE